MQDAQSNLGHAFKNFFAGVTSLLSTGSWHLKETADDARGVDQVLDEAQEAIDQDAQKTLDHVDDAITQFEIMKQKAERQRNISKDWENKAKSAADKAKELPEGSPDRTKMEGLVKSALSEKLKSDGLLKILDDAVTGAQDDYDKATAAIQQVGLNKAHAQSQAASMSVEAATAEARQHLAAATRAGSVNTSKGLLDEAAEKVMRFKAKTEADETISAGMPADASTIGAQIDALSHNDEVDAAFKELMGTTPATSTP
jgi:phage shock protein A